eukprot:PhF_6_TR15048/c0_g1_i1/m.23622/K00148/fdhA; glutathione-independent formaldehyde dehydrogenase
MRRTIQRLGGNRGVVYLGPGKVEVRDIPFPELYLKEQNRKLNHGVILKVLTTNICGSDQHMVRGRTTAPQGLVLGHEITGEVLEVGTDVEYIKKGDICSVPFNIACGRCRNCKEGHTGVCLNVNPARPGAAYGYVDMGGWIGGQAEYVTIPYADFNLLKFPGPKDLVMEKIKDLTLLSDIIPTGYHGCVTAGVKAGSTVYIGGAGPVGLAAASSARLLGAACVIVGDVIPARLEQARSFGCIPINVRDAPVPEQIAKILGSPEVDCAVDCVGFEATCCHGHEQEPASQVLDDCIAITKAAGSMGIPGLYVTGDPGAVTEGAKVGNLRVNIGLAWAKSLSMTTGQCPVMKYNRNLMQAILLGNWTPSKHVNVKVISLEDAPNGYHEFDKGAAVKYVIDPHNQLKK